MAISNADYTTLWSRAGGICSNPDCRQDLTILLQDKTTYHVGEMAHIIARKPDGPRGVAGGGPDSYDNLILLCPTCHRKIDKAPDGTYPEELLHRWKADHEAEIRTVARAGKFADFDGLKKFVSPLLAENYRIWKALGPQSEVAEANPGSNLYLLWDLRKLDRIIPNNRKVVDAIEANRGLLDARGESLFLDFKTHAEAFAANQSERLDHYPTFPAGFGKLFAA